jgi:hypothetical protein
MKKTALIILIFGMIVSCNMKRNIAIESETAFDSTYYFMLKEAYNDNDTIQLGVFFEQWYEASSKMEMDNESGIAKILNDIFIAVYHDPFGYKNRKPDRQVPPLPPPLDPFYSGYKYAILPSEIIYKITDSTSYIPEEERDTLKRFYPNPDLGSTKRLLDIDPFKMSMELFLAVNDSLEYESRMENYKKWRFLRSCKNIYSPISRSKDLYLTDPNIYFISINTELNKAIVTLRAISSGVSVELSFIDNQWNMEKTNDLWIE